MLPIIVNVFENIIIDYAKSTFRCKLLQMATWLRYNRVAVEHPYLFFFR